jgi:enoyl-CoA hydratase
MDFVRTEVDSGIARITIDRPQALNALSGEVLDQLDAAFAQCRADRIRVIVLTGAGEKAFVAGADIAAMAEFGPAEGLSFARKGQAVFDRVAGHDGIVIAAVNGFALGGGMELAMSCDLIVAAENAKFAQPEVNLGVIPGWGGTQRLVRRVGLQRAKELIATGRMVGAEEAVRLGIAIEVVPKGEAVARSLELGRLILGKAPLAVLSAKRLCELGLDGTLRDGLAAEAEAFSACFATEDQKVGMRAFIAKQPAHFQGR